MGTLPAYLLYLSQTWKPREFERDIVTILSTTSPELSEDLKIKFFTLLKSESMFSRFRALHITPTKLHWLLKVWKIESWSHLFLEWTYFPHHPVGLLDRPVSVPFQKSVVHLISKVTTRLCKSADDSFKGYGCGKCDDTYFMVGVFFWHGTPCELLPPPTRNTDAYLQTFDPRNCEPWTSCAILSAQWLIKLDLNKVRYWFLFWLEI